MYTRNHSRQRLGSFEGLGVSRTLGNQFGYHRQFGDVYDAKQELQTAKKNQKDKCWFEGTYGPHQPSVVAACALAKTQVKSAEKKLWRAEKDAKEPSGFERVAGLLTGIIGIGAKVYVSEAERKAAEKKAKEEGRTSGGGGGGGGRDRQASGPSTGMMLGIGGAVIAVVLLIVVMKK